MAILQQANGTFVGNGTFTPTLPAASSASNLVVVVVTGNTTVATPAGWTLRTSQVNWMGQYLWDRPGGAAAYSFSANGQVNWYIAEVTAGAFDIAKSQNDPTSGTSYSTPSLTPTAGQRVLLASIGSMQTGGPARTVTAWTSGFVEQADTCTTTGDWPSGAEATLDLAAASGSTAYSTTGTFSTTGSFGRTAIIGSYVTSSGGPAPVTATAALAGSGTLAATRLARYTRSGGLAGAGALSATARPVYARTATLSGAGQLAAARQASYVRAAQAGGTGTLTGTVSAATTAALIGAGTLHAAAVPVYQRTAALSSTGTLTAERQAEYTRTADLAGDGTLTADRHAVYTRTSTGTSEGTLSATAASGTTRQAALAGSGALAASVDQITYTRSALLGGTGQLTGDRRAIYARASAFTADGLLAGTARIVYIRAGQFTGTGTLTVRTFLPDLARDITATATIRPSPWTAALRSSTWAAATITRWTATITEAHMRTDSIEYLAAVIAADHDISADTVQLSVDNGATWLPADKIGDNTWGMLVGPGHLPLTAGNHRLLAKPTDNPEVPVLDAGAFNVEPGAV